MKARLSGLIDFVLDTIFPEDPVCAACGRGLDAEVSGRLCDACISWTRRPFVLAQRLCPVCGRPTQAPGVCHECRDRPRSFLRVTPAALYREPVRGLIVRLKYSRRADLARPLGHLMHWALGCATHDLLVPVPLHPSHLSSRQYNQAGLLAAEITRLRALPLVHALTKHKQPQSQTTLDREQRLKALAGAFRAARGASRLVRDARVLLVDDVFTTGATAHACACVLLEMGALRVDVAVAAAGIPFESAAKRGVLSPR